MKIHAAAGPALRAAASMTRTIGRLKLSSLCGENRSDSGPNRSPIPVEIDRSPSGAERRGTTRRRVRPSCFFAGGTNAGEQEVVHERFASPVESARLPSGPSRSTGPALRAAASMTRTIGRLKLSSLCGENRSDSGPNRSLIPVETDHRFRPKPITDSGRNRSPSVGADAAALRDER